MTEPKSKIESYFDLAEHSLAQKIVFLSILLVGIFTIFLGILLPLMDFIFRVYLEGVVHNVTDEILSDSNNPEKQKQVHYIKLWAIDIYKNTPQEARYWFEPITSLLIPSIVFGLGGSIFITTLLPSKIGFMRQKIEREIANFVSKIIYSREDAKNETPETIERIIINSNLRELYSHSEKWDIFIEDLKTLRLALIWKHSSFFFKIIHINYGLTMYMRYYFVVKYGNAILGLVYMGAAVLIIIIGLRGLKFIPSTQPSLVFFALGLEFSLLITYAFTLMYGRQDDETRQSSDKSASSDTIDLFSSFKPVNSKEVENLLRVFIKTSRKGKDN